MHFCRLLCVAGLLWVWGSGSLSAQNAAAQKIPAPENIDLETKDGVLLKATYYGGLAKQKSIPVIMIHGWEGSRGEYDTLARVLQEKGHSIIVPDLRGHGQSTTQKTGDGTRTLEADKLRPAELADMVLDVEACKKYLMQKNNAGELNINALCVVGADFGSILALRWAALDMTVPPLLAYKQGQDVKALVLLSPMQAFKGLTVREALAVPEVRRDLSMMIVSGKQDNKGLPEAKRMHNSLQTFHAKVSNDPEEIKKKQDLFLVTPETSLQGTKLLDRGLPILGNIVNFINLRLVNKLDEYSWSDRKRPTD